MTVTIRRAGPDDLELVVEGRLGFLCEVRDLERDALDASFVEATRSFLERTHGRSFHSWLAETAESGVGGRAAGSTVGIASLITSDAPPRPEELRSIDGYVVNMHVDARHRRRGIAQRLLEACLADAAELGVRRIDLHATDDGRPLYAANGFVDMASWMERRL